MFTKAANHNSIREVGRICLPELLVKEVWSLHMSSKGTLNKFLRGFFMFSARPKLRILNEGCDTCLVKERSMPARTGVNVPSLTGYVGEKLYIDLVSMSDTVRGNQYLLTAEDSFSRYCHAYPLLPKYWWIITSTSTDCQINYTWIMVENL